MDEDDYDDPEKEAEWLQAQRQTVLEYLSKQGANHGGLPDEPGFFVAPCFAIWPVESGKVAGSVGWWVVSGDLPTDYISATGIGDMRGAMKAFARQWQEVAGCMLRGKPHPSIAIGKPADWPELGGVLSSRADFFKKFAEDDSNWS